MKFSVARRRLFEPVDAASLGAFRLAFGAILAWEVGRYFEHDWIEEYYIRPPYHFHYLFFDWVRPWPGTGMYWHFAALGLLAALVCLGLFYRPAIFLLFLGLAYVFLLEQARYLNHIYLVCLLAFLLIWVGADRWLSVDGWLAGGRFPATVPGWQLFLLHAQLFLVYFYAGIAKLNHDWLIRHEPLRSWLANDAGLPLIGPLLTQEWVVAAACWGAALFDLSIGFLLVWPRARKLAVVLVCLFHATNHFVFEIGIFPFLGMAATLLFLDPGWPRHVLKAVYRLLGTNRPGALGIVAVRQPDAQLPAPGACGSTLNAERFTLACLALYLGWQVLFPLRHLLYPGDVAWTEEGHRFSWRMKLRGKRATLIQVQVRDPSTGLFRLVDPGQYLTAWQQRSMGARPDMVLQFAHMVRDGMHAEGIGRPQVYVDLLCTLNGRPARPLIDRTTDLAREPRTLWPARWILPRDD